MQRNLHKAIKGMFLTALGRGDPQHDQSVGRQLHRLGEMADPLIREQGKGGIVPATLGKALRGVWGQGVTLHANVESEFLLGCQVP